MEKIIIFGHKNPDTDTICSAIAYADLKQQLGFHAEPVRLGSINHETQFALDTFQTAVPRLVKTVAHEGARVILVDHNERQQSANDIDQVEIIEVIDHHRIANFETSSPLYYRAEPVASTATILYKLYQEHKQPLQPHIAGLLLSAIISDSLLFKSPTCTEQDVTIAYELAEIASVDIQDYGLALLKAGADLSQTSIAELISLDAKAFTVMGTKIEIAQVNAIDVQDVLSRQAAVETQLLDTIVQKKLDLFMLVITDILRGDSHALALGAKAYLIEEAYNVKLQNNTALLKGVVSRKKQIVPLLTHILNRTEN